MDEPQQIGFTAAESTPRFPYDPKPPSGAPNVIAIVLDDTGFGHLGAFGSDIGTPHLDGLGGTGRAVQPVPRHLPVLTDEGVVLHRPQPPRGRDGFPGRHSAGLPGLPRPPARYGRHPAPPPARRRLLDHGRRQVASHAALAALGSGAVRHLAARAGLRALLRLPAGRHQPLDPEPRLRQPLHRAAPAARGGLPPDRGPGRSGRPHGAGPAAGRAGQALLPVLRPRRHARPAPCGARVGRPVPGCVRQGVGRLARRGVRPPVRRRGSCRPARCSRSGPNGCSRGTSSRPRSGACSAASRRSSPAS